MCSATVIHVDRKKRFKETNIEKSRFSVLTVIIGLCHGFRGGSSRNFPKGCCPGCLPTAPQKEKYSIVLTSPVRKEREPWCSPISSEKYHL